MKLFLAVMVLAGGCDGVGRQIPGDGKLVVVSYDDAFDQNYLDGGELESVAVREGIRYWNRLGANLHTPDEVTAEMAASAPATYSVHRDTFSWPGLENKPIGACLPSLGYAVIYTSVIRENGMTLAGLREAVAHEIGHAIGLNHTNLGGIMFPARNWNESSPSNTDRIEYETHYLPVGMHRPVSDD